MEGKTRRGELLVPEIAIAVREEVHQVGDCIFWRLDDTIQKHGMRVGLGGDGQEKADF